MKKIFSIVVLILLFGIHANAQPSSEYLGNNEWLVKYSSNCTYKGALKGIGKKKGLFKTKQTGIQHGYGIFDCDGGVAEGQFLDGKFVQGIMNTPSGDRFEGSFDTNLKLNGEGAAYYKNGQTLIGNFSEGNLDGKGKLIEPNGSFWEGNFNYGKIRGEATYYDAKEKKTWKGNFTKDGFVGLTKIYHDNGVIQSGKCQNGSCNFDTIKSLEDIQKVEKQNKDNKDLYKKIYNKCILENLKGQTDKEAIKIIKDVCKDKAENPSMLDKLFN